ncbi:MAG: hypothetical protein ACO1SX_18585 [Actinomycetota bacterium]
MNRNALLALTYVEVQPPRAVRLTLETAGGKMVQTEEVAAKEDLVGRRRRLIARDHGGKLVAPRVSVAEPSPEPVNVRLSRAREGAKGKLGFGF